MGEKGGSFPLHMGIELGGRLKRECSPGEPLPRPYMPHNERRSWLLIFLASHKEEARNLEIVSLIIRSICQSNTQEGICKEEITTEESPSRIT